MAAKSFGSASGNKALHPPWCEYGEMLSNSTGVEAWCRRGTETERVYQCMLVCLINEIHIPLNVCKLRHTCKPWSANNLMNNIRVKLSLTHAAREYRRKQKTLLMSCFKRCKSCQCAGCVLEHAVGLLCCVDIYELSLLY